ncbi:MAG: flavodoxin family protein [Methanomicrobiales archaeon]|nr:flavodoxin family protein [Methanomicrobiales archaeon]MDI6876717.1 flavodoxin family protein [Methanomicrobiales archaeon]
MKVVAINGSARKDGNTARLIRYVLDELEKEGIETEMVHLAGETVRGCTACMGCAASGDGRCTIEDDIVNACIGKMREADGIILGSPTYFADVSSEMKALIDRAGFVARANGDMFQRKAGAAVVAVRRAGAIHAFDTINHFFLISQMIVVGSSYWNVGIGLAPGDVERDAEGIETMRTLGRNLAWILGRLHPGG